MSDRPPPYAAAWADQFGALLRDKCRQMQEIIYLTDWPNLAIEFEDIYDGDYYRLSWRAGSFWVTNLSEDPDYDIQLDLEALGVNRHVR
jgi:hypothetical protein